jgi:DNA-binding transcriptional regulator YiaG
MKREGMFHYTQCGLDDVWLANGFHVEETEYGAGFRIEHATELHLVIAMSIVNGKRPLRGQEVRFLRTVMNLSQETLAKALGVDRATVHRWEKARDKPLAMMQDIAVRTTYAARAKGDDEFLVGVVKELQDADEAEHGEAFQAVFEASNNGWRAKAAA